MIEDEIDKHKEFASFIKVTDKSLGSLKSEDKVALNRRGNVLFNKGETEAARKIFTATGYSDGLTRVGKVYEDQHKPLDALKQYVLAHNERRADSIYENMAQILSCIMKEGGDDVLRDEQSGE